MTWLSPRWLLLLITLAFAGCQPVGKQAVYTVPQYNPEADPAVDLAMTAKRAQAEHKRIILQVGGEWCQFCHRLDAFIRDTPSVAAGIARRVSDYEGKLHAGAK